MPWKSKQFSFQHLLWIPVFLDLAYITSHRSSSLFYANVNNKAITRQRAASSSLGLGAVWSRAWEQAVVARRYERPVPGHTPRSHTHSTLGAARKWCNMMQYDAKWCNATSHMSHTMQTRTFHTWGHSQMMQGVFTSYPRPIHKYFLKGISMVSEINMGPYIICGRPLHYVGRSSDPLHSTWPLARLTDWTGPTVSCKAGLRSSQLAANMPRILLNINFQNLHKMQSSNLISTNNQGLDYVHFRKDWLINLVLLISTLIDLV